jgi:hypothetical protein
MTDQYSSESLQALFKFPFTSPNGKSRFLAATGMLLLGYIIPIVPVLFLYGYIVRVMRQAIRGEELVMPEWKDWGGLARDGFQAWLVGLIYSAPGAIVMFAGWFLYLAVYIGAMTQITGKPGSEPSGIFFLLIFGSIAILIISMFFGWILAALGLIPLPAALAHSVARGRLGAALSIREWAAILKADKWGYFIAWVLMLGLVGLFYFGFMSVYFIAIFVWPVFLVIIPVGLYLLLVAAAIFGRFYRQAAERLEAKQ